MLWVFTFGLGWKPGMLRQGIVPTQEQVQALFHWPKENDDPDGWLEYAFQYLLADVEGKTRRDVQVPLVYDLGAMCELCNQPRRYVIHTLDKMPSLSCFRCGEKRHYGFP